MKEPATIRTHDARLPLVLRRECYGGILFDSREATHLEMDAEGFAVVYDWLSAGLTPTTAAGRAFLAQVRSEMPAVARERPLRVHNGIAPQPVSQGYVPVLTAPTLVDVQITKRCPLACPHCYVDASPNGAHMSDRDVHTALRAFADAGVCQLAIGGGEPLLHPGIIDVLNEAHELGLVPNITTTGINLTDAVLDAMARVCGAVALSLEAVGEEFGARRRSGFDFFKATLARLRAYGISTVLQVTLSTENLRAIPAIVDFCLAQADLYGVIFLAYKAIGRGARFHTPLSTVDAAVFRPKLRDAFLRLVGHTRVGYDCCLTPAIIGMDRDLGFSDYDLLEGCSATRSSLGVTVDLDVVPCTFITETPLGNLRERSLSDIWRGAAARAFRDSQQRRGEGELSCRVCASRPNCMGGCPAWDLVPCTNRNPSPASIDS